jgi:hypothetical protein
MVHRAGRRVLVVVHAVAGIRRLLDAADLVETDRRVRTVFAAAPCSFDRIVDNHLVRIGARVVPWAEASRERFDLVLATSPDGLAGVGGPVVLLPGRRQLREPERPGSDGGGRGHIVVVGHESQGRLVPRGSVTRVAGDVSYDRLLRCLRERARHRRALGIGDHENLLVAAATYGRHGAFHTLPDLLPTLMTGPFRVAALLHPAIWAHGRRQVRAWTAEAREAGLILPDPTRDWRPLLAAADFVVGDHGSIITYAAAAGIPALRLPGRVAPAPGQEGLGVLDLGGLLHPQLVHAPRVDAAAVAAHLTSCPGTAEERLRRLLYQTLALPLPSAHRPALSPVP